MNLEQFRKLRQPTESEYAKIAPELRLSPNMLSESDELDREYNEERVKAWEEHRKRKFSLREENFCIRVWQPWFKAGGWSLIDLTRSGSTLLQVDDMDISDSVKSLIWMSLDGIFPCDGVIFRWGQLFPIDYKFIHKASYGLGVIEKDYKGYYDGYVAKSIPFILLIWDNLHKMRWTHLVSKSILSRHAEYDERYLDITEDCVKPSFIPFKNPNPKNAIEQLTAQLKAQDLDWHGSLTEECCLQTLKNLQTNKLQQLFTTVEREARKKRNR